MSNKVYIMDLEGTLGIFSRTEHINDIILIRPGLKTTIEYFLRQGINFAIATRAPKEYVNKIVENLKKVGLNLGDTILTRDQVEFNDPFKRSYKDFSAIYAKYKITNPEKEAIVLGDFLRFDSFSSFTEEKYFNFDFVKNPKVLSSNYALNDHPLPSSSEPPIYVVLPQLWTTFDSDGELRSLSLDYTIRFLERLFELGEDNFSAGFNTLMVVGTPTVTP